MIIFAQLGHFVSLCGSLMSQPSKFVSHMLIECRLSIFTIVFLFLLTMLNLCFVSFFCHGFMSAGDLNMFSNPNLLLIYCSLFLLLYWSIIHIVYDLIFWTCGAPHTDYELFMLVYSMCSAAPPSCLQRWAGRKHTL